MKTSRFLEVVSIATTTLVLLGPVTASAQPDTLKIGVIASLSGPAAPYGIPERDIVKIVADRYNAAGGINGRKIELIIEDDQTNPTEAARDATRLIRQDNVIAIIGASTGSATLAFAPIAANAKVPVYAPVATQSVTSRQHTFFPWVFRSAPASAVTMQAMMKRKVFQPNIKKVAIMYQEDAYGKEESDMAQKLIKAHGGIDIVAAVSAPLSATDLSSAATRIRNSNPDIVLLLTSAPAMGGAFARGAEQAQLKAPILGSLSLNQKAFVDAAGKAGNGVMSVTLGNWFEPSAKQAELGKILQQAGKKPEGYGEIIGSSSIIILAEAIKNIKGEITGQSIRDATEKLCGFDGTYSDGKVCYSPEQHDGYGADTVNVVELQDGKWKNVK
jgi:branched-chain amino acid transport system substrate-binding protein